MSYDERHQAAHTGGEAMMCSEYIHVLSYIYIPLCILMFAFSLYMNHIHKCNSMPIHILYTLHILHTYMYMLYRAIIWSGSNTCGRPPTPTPLSSHIYPSLVM